MSGARVYYYSDDDTIIVFVFRRENRERVVVTVLYIIHILLYRFARPTSLHVRVRCKTKYYTKLYYYYSFSTLIHYIINIIYYMASYIECSPITHCNTTTYYFIFSIILLILLLFISHWNR